MKLVAHSSPKVRPDIEPHSYQAHIEEAVIYGMAIADDALQYFAVADDFKKQLLDTLKAAIMLHDLGKLDGLNQAVLSGRQSGRLEIDHIDAGVAIAEKMGNQLLGWLIRGHHAPGLPSKTAEKLFKRSLENNLRKNILTKLSLRGARRGRDDSQDMVLSQQHYQLISHTNQHLAEYIQQQIDACGPYPSLPIVLPDQGLLTRLLLSCLVDADHESAATYSVGEPMPTYRPPLPKWEQRIRQLDIYMQGVRASAAEPMSSRNQLREQFYRCCATGALVNSPLLACSTPVGLGKTTSVTAYLLREALAHNLRRIIVIAPFTNVISQTVKTLRKALVLGGEEPDQIVVAHHHKVEFSSKEMRQYTTLWKAPVVVTTAVQFFETLASADPTRLRKLNGLPGSAIFIDESHACLPPELLRVSWRWLKELAECWGCKIVFSSGSLVEYWKYECFVGSERCQTLPDILSDELKALAFDAEGARIEFHRIGDAIDLSTLIEVLKIKASDLIRSDEKRPSVLMILNTVQSAAVVAYALSGEIEGASHPVLNDRKVLHLSTALAPKDRDLILAEVERRQGESEWSERVWFLVATSCVEAGVDLDFAVGYRERCSVTSFLQVAGRINRHNVRENGVLYDFFLIPDNDGLIQHPGFKASQEIFSDLWDEIVESDDLIALSTKALKREMARSGDKEKLAISLDENEGDNNFQEVMTDFRVINSDTATVVVDRELVEKLERGIPVKWQEIQMKSVQLWHSKISKLHLKPIKNVPNGELYSWIDTYTYDPDFIGIMGGLLSVSDFFEKKGGVF